MAERCRQGRGDGEWGSGRHRGLGIGEEISGVSDPFDGLIDEIRIATVVRSDAWLKATYRNLSTPASFLTAGSEETVGGGGPAPATRRPIIMVIFA